jgi:hypothetical protein
MDRQLGDGQPLGFSMDVAAAGIHVSTAAPPAISPALPENTQGGSGGLPTGRPDASQPIPEPPSLLGTAASFAGSMAKFAASGFKRVDEQSHQLRMNQCGPCEYRKDTRCMLCRCFVAKKAWLPHKDCPIGRWPT